MVKPKGKGGKGKKGGGGDGLKKLKAVPEGLELNEMSKKQLRKHVMKLFVEIDREREERNFFMLERERQFLLWNMVLEQISQDKEKARVAELKYDEAEAEKEKEMKSWKHKLRNFMSEETDKISQARLANLYRMKRIQDEIWEILMMLRESNWEKHSQWRVMQQSKYGILQMLQQNHSDEVTALRTQFAEEIKRMTLTTERAIDAERDSIQVKNAAELATIRTNKEDQLDHMLYTHEKQLLEMKTFFNDLEVNNMAVISSLQQEIAHKKLNERRLQRTLKQTMDKYNDLLLPVEDLEDKMVEWEEDEEEMAKVRRDIADAEHQLAQNKHYIRMMSCASEALFQKSKYIKRERDGLRDCFASSVIDNQMRATMGRMVSGFRNRAMEAGILEANPKACVPKTSSAIKKHAICKTLEPIFKTTPFEFNDCIFPKIDQPYCRVPRQIPMHRKGPSDLDFCSAKGFRRQVPVFRGYDVDHASPSQLALKQESRVKFSTTDIIFSDE